MYGDCAVAKKLVNNLPNYIKKGYYTGKRNQREIEW